MKLNQDCMRDVMLCLERLLTVEIDPDDGCVNLDSISSRQVCADLPQWKAEDAFYSLFCLEQAGFINASIMQADDIIGEHEINYMTYAGHEFLESIRDDGRWGTVKKGLASIRNYSLSAISSIAEGITAGAITSYLSQK